MSETLFICPRCRRQGFSLRGLHAHQCRGNGTSDERRALTAAELCNADCYIVGPAPSAAPRLRGKTKGGAK